MSNGELILYTTEDGKTAIHLKAEGKTVWLTQMELADLFQTTKQNISLHIKNILSTNELSEAVVKDNLTTAADGKRYKTKLYNLSMILAAINPMLALRKKLRSKLSLSCFLSAIPFLSISLIANANPHTFMDSHQHGVISLPHSCEERCFDHSFHSVTKPREEGYIQVSKIHSLFYATYGNPDGIPVVILHGGPGAGCDDALSRFFDLSHWNVVMFDQRGAMRSRPFGCMEENSPQHSINDIEILRNHLGIEKWMIFGGSWGSTLAILYGQAHPERCTGFILRGIFLGREQDYLHVIYGMGKVFPEAYASFVHHIPVEEREDLLSAYYNRIMDPDPEIHMPAARKFMQFDLTCSTHLPNKEAMEKILYNDKLLLSMTRPFLYYSIHRFFLEPNQILSQMHKITHLPAIIVHGRWDAICLPEMAYFLHQNWHNSTLWVIPTGGHSANDPAIAAALGSATDIFAEKLGANF